MSSLRNQPPLRLFDDSLRTSSHRRRSLPRVPRSSHRRRAGPQDASLRCVECTAPTLSTDACPVQPTPGRGSVTTPLASPVDVVKMLYGTPGRTTPTLRGCTVTRTPQRLSLLLYTAHCHPPRPCPAAGQAHVFIPGCIRDRRVYYRPPRTAWTDLRSGASPDSPPARPPARSPTRPSSTCDTVSWLCVRELCW